MKGYTVTVIPDDATEATATIHYELTGGAPRLTDVHFRAGHGQSLSAARMPDIDIAQLLTAVVPAVAATAAPAALPATRVAADVDAASPDVRRPAAAASPARSSAADVPVPAAAPRQRRVTASKPAPTMRSKRPGSATAAAAPSKKAPSKTTPSKKSAAKKAPSKTAASAPPAKTAAPATATTKGAAKSTRPATTSGTANLADAAEAAGRVRRLMPDDFADMYRQAPTVAAVADYYQVPTYTAQGWVQTARKRGLIPPARSRRS